jgi:hypothetical protein
MMTDPAEGQDLSQQPDCEPLWHTDERKWPPLDEETIAQIADEAFLEYDIREAECGHRSGVSQESDSAFEEFNHHE